MKSKTMIGVIFMGSLLFNISSWAEPCSGAKVFSCEMVNGKCPNYTQVTNIGITMGLNVKYANCKNVNGVCKVVPGDYCQLN